jgi:hypothetical protein
MHILRPIEHVKLCPKRVLSCEPTMKVCEKLLHSWFYKELPHPSSSSVNEEEKAGNEMESRGKEIVARTPLVREGEEELGTASYLLEMSEVSLASLPLDESQERGREREKSWMVASNSAEEGFKEPFPSLLSAKTAQWGSNVVSRSTSSVYFESHKMKLYEGLRFHVCERHHCTIIMAAIR